jgi:hypothetical protein
VTRLRFTAPLETMSIEDGYDPIGFVVLDGELGEAVSAHELARRLERGRRRGFNSVKVSAAIGATRWRTSLFPRKSGGWFLPIKKPVRLAEGLAEGEPVEVMLELD